MLLVFITPQFSLVEVSINQIFQRDQSFLSKTFAKIFTSLMWRRVICSKFICSKKLLNTKISIAQHCSSRWQKYMHLLENQKSMPYMSCQADAFFRQKWITAQIATARQKIWKMSTAWQKIWKMSTARQYFFVKMV